MSEQRSIDLDITETLLALSLSPGSNASGVRHIDDSRTSSEERSPIKPPAEVPPPTSISVLVNESPQLPDVPSAQKCLVLLQDACNLHKFSRNVRQRELDLVVERPERTRAAILGILNTKARLELCGAANFDVIHSVRRGWLGDKAVEDVHGYVYPQELLQLSKTAGAKLLQGLLEIPESMPYGDLYLAPESLDALNGCLGVLYDGIDALYRQENDIAGISQRDRVHVCLRPPGHHAAETSPCGFCWINNVHVAIAYAREKYGVQRAAILDIDLHHGDGSQSIAWQLNEATPNAIGYFSLHDIYSYPCESGNVDKIREASVSIAAHGHHIHNVHLRTFQDQNEFDHLYETSYSKLFSAAEMYLAEGHAKGEKTLVCISAGYDASEYESSAMQRHAVSVPTRFFERFTKDSLVLAQKYAGNKIFTVMEGGYGDRAIISSSSAHLLGLAHTPDTPPLPQCYSLENVKLLEKNWPGKSKSGKKSLKQDLANNDWLTRVEQLYNEHIGTKSVEPTSHFEEPVSLGLSRMTLRERKLRSTNGGREVSTPKSTPVKHERLPNTVPRARTERQQHFADSPVDRKVTKSTAVGAIPPVMNDNLPEKVLETELPVSPRHPSPAKSEPLAENIATPEVLRKTDIYDFPE